MQLTKEQIQQIENYLDFKDLKHIDVRLEVLDHMISDIETSMQKNHLNFSQAFKRTIVQWKDQLKIDSSWYLGATYSAPSVVIKKAEQSYKKWFFLIFIFSILPAIKMNYWSFLNHFDNYLVWIVFTLMTPFSLLIIIWYYIMKKKDIKTTHQFLFEKQIFYPTVTIITISVAFGFFNLNLSLYFMLLQIILFFIGKGFMKKHQKIIERYQLK